MTGQQRFRRWGASLVLFGAASAVTWFLAITSFTGAVANMATGPLPDAELNLKAGDQAVFLEGDIFNGIKVCGCSRAENSSVTITGVNGAVPTVHSNANEFKKGDFDGVQIAQVTIPSDGRYRVHTDTRDDDADTIAIGTYDPNITMAIVAAGLSFVALVCLMFTEVARRDRKSTVAAGAHAVSPPVAVSATSPGLDNVMLQLDGLDGQREFQSPETIRTWTKDFLDYALAQGQINQADYDRLVAERLGPPTS